MLSRPLTPIADRDQRERVRIASLWQDRVTLYALYPDGTVRGWAYDGHAATRHLQLGAMIQWRLDPKLGAPVRLLWRVDRSANLRGIVVAPMLATAAEASRANIAMAAIYSGFAGLCIALLVYNLAMWGALRHRFQLAYCAMVLSLLLYAFTSSGALAWACPTILNNDRLRLNYLLLASAAGTALMPYGRLLRSARPRLSLARRRPVGVVGIVSPFNFPGILSARSIAPALALGNAVVLKPDPRTTVSGGLFFAAVLEEAGLPAGVFSVKPSGYPAAARSCFALVGLYG